MLILNHLQNQQSLKALLDTIYHDMNRISEIYYHGRGGTDFSWERKMTDLVSSTLEYVSYKKEMTDLYPTFLSILSLKLLIGICSVLYVCIMYLTFL